MRRVVSVWFPTFPTDRSQRIGAPRPERGPFITFTQPSSLAQHRTSFSAFVAHSRRRTLDSPHTLRRIAPV